MIRATPEGRSAGEPPHWFAPGDAPLHERLGAQYTALAATVDPDDPWSHPDASALDRLSVADWLRSQDATPAVVRLWEIGQLALAGGSYERISLLAALRKSAAVPGSGSGDYDYEDWEGLRLARGSATLAEVMGRELGPRIRLGSPVAALDVRPGGCTVRLVTGETLTATAVVSALPVGPLRSVAVSGVGEARLASLRRQRHATAAKFAAVYDRPFWRDAGLNGLSEAEGVLGSTWSQNEGVLSALIPPERYGVLLGTPPALRTPELLAEMADMFGDEALRPTACHLRLWGTDPWTQGYVTQWPPGEVMAVGPLHGTHEPPFYVCGSDQWGAGYMEGAVRTGRAAAEEALRRG